MSALSELASIRRSKVPRRDKPSKAERREGRAAYVFLLPWILGTALLTIGPMVVSLALSFTDYNLLQPPSWIGFDNFSRMLEDARLQNSLNVTFRFVAFSLPLQLLAALLLAVALDRGVRGLAFYRSIFYLPSLLGGSVAIAVLWRQIFGIEGLVNQVIAPLGIEGQGWVSSPDTALGTLVILNVWTFGAPMIIFLAGLRQIPVMYYEAASWTVRPRSGSSSPSRFPSSRRSSSSISSWESLVPFNRSPRHSSCRTGLVAQLIRRCSTRCIYIRWGSTISTWATPRPWPGSCW